MSVHRLHACHDDALDLIAMTDERAKQLVAPILREILELRELGVSAAKVEVLVDALRLCCRLNDAMRERAAQITRQLDEMIAIVERLNVKALAAELRPHLAIIAKPEAHDVAAYVPAICAVRDLIGVTPRERLAGGGLQRALGPGRHELLMGLIGPERTQRIPREETPIAGCAGGEAVSHTVPAALTGLATSSLEQVA